MLAWLWSQGIERLWLTTEGGSLTDRTDQGELRYEMSRFRQYMIEILPARTAAELAIARALFLEYAAAIGVDLEYQGFSDELATLPGKYAPPTGELLLARVNNALAGCVALRALDRRTLEMKRLYVRPSTRGTGLGRRLVEAAIAISRQGAYSELRLDTLATMNPARALYQSLGFVEIPPYGDGHLPGTVFYGLTLTE